MFEHFIVPLKAACVRACDKLLFCWKCKIKHLQKEGLTTRGIQTLLYVASLCIYCNVAWCISAKHRRKRRLKNSTESEINWYHSRWIGMYLNRKEWDEEMWKTKVSFSSTFFPFLLRRWKCILSFKWRSKVDNSHKQRCKVFMIQIVGFWPKLLSWLR